MATLPIARRSETYGTNSARHHVVGVLLMSLDVCTEFQVDMLLIIKVFSGEKIVGRQGL